MQQEKTPYFSSVAGVTTTTSIMYIPFDSNTPTSCPIYGELHCIGLAEISSVMKRFYFILPFVYNTNNSPMSIPIEGVDYGVASTVFSHMEIIDDSIITAMAIQLVPDSTGIGITFKPPSAGGWDVNCVCYIYKRLN